MSSNFFNKQRVKYVALCFCISFGIIGVFNYFSKPERVKASITGPSPSYTAAPGETSCVQCHQGNAVNTEGGTLSIAGLPQNYRPNQQIPLTVTLNRDEAVTFGFQLTAVDSAGKTVGVFTLPNEQFPTMQQVDGIVGGQNRKYVQHTNEGVSPTTFGTRSWTFNWTVPERLAGKISFHAAANAANGDGGPNGDYIYTASDATLSNSAIANFEGDLKSDIGIFRPSSGEWYSIDSEDQSVRYLQFGMNGDIPVPGDYDGDGTSDHALFRPSNGVWFAALSSGGLMVSQFGSSGDIPVSGDFDGDQKTDLAVFRPSEGKWYISRSTGGLSIDQFGLTGDIPVVGDYDGDGKSDIALYRPSNRVWYLLRSTDGFLAAQFGLSTDIPVQADYDGDGKYDIAVFRPSEGNWYWLGSTSGFAALHFGADGDVPAPADYTGDGKADQAVFRNGVHYVLNSEDYSVQTVGFGLTGDIPIASGYLAQ